MLLSALIAVSMSKTLEQAPETVMGTPIYGCEPYPKDADQDCQDCMNDACGKYFQAVAECGSSEACLNAAWAEYQLNVLLCPTCNPAAHVFPSFVAALPESERDWVAGSLLAYRRASHPVVSPPPHLSGANQLARSTPPSRANQSDLDLAR